MTSMETWSITSAHFTPHFRLREIKCPKGTIERELQRLANERDVGQLEIENYSDEVHSWFSRNGRRYQFIWVQFEG